MSTITSLGASDSGSTSRTTINTNFTNLNADKVEGQASSIDGEIALFSGTGGKTIKRATGSGIAKVTSGVLSTVTAPSGAIVGDTDSQSLTNKTLTSTTNNVAAKSLHSASTVVDVSAATAPSSGQVLTATSSTTATWQTPASAPADYRVRVYQTGVTALTTSWVSCAFAAENFDTDSMHDNVTNNTRITFPHAGTYVIGGVVATAANAVLGARIRLDGSTVLAAQVQGNSGAGERASVSTIYTVTAGQYVELQGYASTQNSTGDTETNFWAYKIA